jgi:hypothetical protein
MMRFSRVPGLFLVLLFVVVPVTAQPFSSWLVKGSGTGYVSIPASSAFDFSNGFTFEAWVNGSDTGSCSSLAGKDYTKAFWVGVCGTTLRSYLHGYTPPTNTQFDGGKVPANEWTHIAVTFDGTTHKHYIDGELVASRAESGPMTTSPTELRISGDTAYQFTYGAIDEVRFWNVARTLDQIRSTITSTINSPQTGLVAVYHLDGSAVDSIGGRNGTNQGTSAYLTSAVALSCAPTTTTQLCILGNRFAISARWLLSGGETGVGTLVPGSNATSGLFWFFGSDNWELLVKMIDACGVLNDRKWVFSAATTNVHYELVVTDVKNGLTKRYFNYQGISAPAVTDTDAFATCP